VPIVAIALGSNLGDRLAHLQFAVDRLQSILHSIRVSPVEETEPFDVPDAQPPYLNAVAVGETDLEPEVLLRRLLAIERERGRERPSVRAARTLDLDLVLYGDRIIDTPALQVPHPRFRERDFVLAPLSELAPGLVDPFTGLTIAELRRALELGPPDKSGQKEHGPR
jgi:2-amino-4-hydroxy-6-hydroxymethyldihydropteridine diphosphokinase